MPLWPPPLIPTSIPTSNPTSRFRCFRCHPVSSSPRWSSPSEPKRTMRGAPSNTPRPAPNSSSCLVTTASMPVSARWPASNRRARCPTARWPQWCAASPASASDKAWSATPPRCGCKSNASRPGTPRRPSPSWHRPIARSLASCSTRSAGVSSPVCSTTCAPLARWPTPSGGGPISTSSRRSSYSRPSTSKRGCARQSTGPAMRWPKPM